MPVMIKDGKTVLFVHIPKCGGSSLESSLKAAGWREFLSIRGVSARDLKFMKCSLQHMHGALLEDLLNLNEFDEIVSIVRNPFDRFRSEYYWQLHENLTPLKPSDWIEQTLAGYSENAFLYDNHIRPQSEFLVDGMKWFKLEDGGIDIALNTLNSGTERTSKFRSLLRSYKGSHLKKTVKEDSIDKVFNQHKDRIVEFYAKDYSTFGYST